MKNRDRYLAALQVLYAALALAAAIVFVVEVARYV
jgi:hypothetical protein